MEQPTLTTTELKSSADLTDREILENLASTDCLGCGGSKEYRNSHCRRDYYRLPPEMRSALYRRFGAGYEQAFRDSIDYLRENYPSK